MLFQYRQFGYEGLYSLIVIALLASVISMTTFANEQTLPTEQTDEWEDDDWGEDEASPLVLSAFTELAYGRFLQNNIVESSSSLKELRARVELNYSHSMFQFTGKGDVLHDKVLSNTRWQTRELNISANPLPMLDLKIGRQVLTWGTGDYLFLNDLFAKDWQSFFSGRDDEYLKAPSDSVRSAWYIGEVTIDLAWTPEFTADKYITGERFSFYSPMAQQLVAPSKSFSVIKTKDAQWSARVAATYNGIEYAIYGYKGFWTTPVGATEAATAYFPELNAWGASIRLPIAQGVFNAEYSFYDTMHTSRM